MCGLCKLNAAALDTTVACGYNGIDQHNLGLLPPIAGIDTSLRTVRGFQPSIAPIAGIDMSVNLPLYLSTPIAPIAGIDTPCRERSAAQQRRPFHNPPSTFRTPSLRSPPHFPFRRGGFCDSKTITKNIFDLTVAPPRKDDTIYMNKENLLHYA